MIRPAFIYLPKDIRKERRQPVGKRPKHNALTAVMPDGDRCDAVRGERLLVMKADFPGDQGLRAKCGDNGDMFAWKGSAKHSHPGYVLIDLEIPEAAGGTQVPDRPFHKFKQPG